ncbi:MAG: response regulator transcription factor [Rubricella sp.]
MSAKVLIVEDEANIADALAFILGRAGYDVQVESDGATAPDRIRALRPDLVVLDVMLPGLSGFDILRQMRADDALSAIPVMMLTAKGQERDRATAESIGANLFVTKPFSNAEVVDAVRTLLTESE